MDSTPSPRVVVERLLAGFAAGATPSLAEFYARDARVELPYAVPGGLRLEGREEIRRHFARAAGLPLRLVPENVVIHETARQDVVIAEYDYRGEVVHTGHRFSVANVQIITVRDGLILCSRDFHDHAALATALRA